MELDRIKDLVAGKAKGNTGVVNVGWSEIEPLLDDSDDCPDKLKRFKQQLKPELVSMGLDFTPIGNKIRFLIKEELPYSSPIKSVKKVSVPAVTTEPSKTSPAPKKKVKRVKPNIEVSDKLDAGVESFLEFACDERVGTDFDHGYIMPPDFMQIKAAVEEEGCYPLLVGDRSVGKSRLAEEIAKRLDRHDRNGNKIGVGRPLTRFCLEEVEEAADIVGFNQLISNPESGQSETVFIPGILTIAWVYGHVLILDEIDRASKAARRQLNMVTEDGGQLMVPTHKGFKFFDKHPDCRFIFTANTWGHGDFTGQYDGAEPLNMAFLSRLGPKFEIKTEWSVYVEILKEYGLPQPAINLLFEKDGGIVQEMHSTIKKNNLQECITKRSFIRFAKMYPTYGWHYGLEVCIINEFMEHNRDLMRDVISKKTNADLEPTDDLQKIESEKCQTALSAVGL